jgi:hypothetical protein
LSKLPQSSCSSFSDCLAAWLSCQQFVNSSICWYTRWGVGCLRLGIMVLFWVFFVMSVS